MTRRHEEGCSEDAGTLEKLVRDREGPQEKQEENRGPGHGFRPKEEANLKSEERERSAVRTVATELGT